MKKKAVIAGIFVLSVIFYIWLWQQYPGLIWDENVYLGNARARIGVSNFAEDFRFPLLEYTIAGIWMITGESLAAAKLLMIAYTLAMLYVFYLIIKEELNPENHTYFLLISFLTPILLTWSFRVYGDIAGMLFVLLSYYLMIKERKSQSIYLILGAGACAGIAFLFRFPLALFGASVTAYLILRIFFEKYKIRMLLSYFAGIALSLIPWMIYNSLNYGNPLWDFTAQYSVVDIYTTWQPISIFFWNFAKNFHVLSIFFLLSLFIFVNRLHGYRQRKTETSMIAFIFLIISLSYYIFFVNMKLERYLLAIMPFILLFAFKAIDEMESWMQSAKRKQFRAMIIILVFISAAYAIPTIDLIMERGWCRTNGPIEQASDHIGELGTEEWVLSNSWPWFGYYNNAHAASLWTENITMLLQKYNVKYIVYSTYDNVPFDKSVLDESELIRMEKSFTNDCGMSAYVYSSADPAE
ncbi:glycosyltransferase family 39 protein [Candidatus Woesearchaeota archaeon]|nr:glycosyltransferase family 39 protein [Candidatus Woesearchaeota archaeon]